MAVKQKRLVMGFGTFDRVHPGHLFYLRELRKLGDELIIVIARDTSVERLKGRRPHFSEEERLQAILKTGIPDRVILGHKKDFLKVLHEHKPHVLGFGYDQQVDTEALKLKFPHIEMVRVVAYEPHKFKSSLIMIENAPNQLRL
ncbi:MAG: adenylyltransferase/cytidyltransferase family protein [Patescibacteria group bacterium]